MTTAFDVPADSLISAVSKELKENDKINAPAWTLFVKTGVHKERRPEDPDWWYATRAMSAFALVVAEAIDAKYIVPTDIAMAYGILELVKKGVDEL